MTTSRRGISRRCARGLKRGPTVRGPLETVADDVIWEVVGNSVASRVYNGKQDFLSNVIRRFNARLAVP
ncbi:MAG: hypothetical protein ACXWEI_11955 [Mycobacterium sp.]